MTRDRLRFWIEAFTLVFSVIMIGVLGLGVLKLHTDFLSYYHRLPVNPSISIRGIEMAFVNSDSIPEAVNSMIYCSLYPNTACCDLGGVMHCKI